MSNVSNVEKVIQEFTNAHGNVFDIGGAKTFKSDIIGESTAGSGVTIDSVLAKDGKVTASGDTAAGDNATMGYTAAEGLVLTGQGSTNDITMKNDADADVLTVATGQTAIARVGGDQTLMIATPDTAYAVLAANSGKVHLVPNLSADRIYTLPTAAAGLSYEFWSTLIAADGHDLQIVAAAAADFYEGCLMWTDSDLTVGPVISAPDGSSDHTLNILLPANFCIKLYCDGTNWFINGTVFASGTPTWT